MNADDAKLNRNIFKEVLETACPWKSGENTISLGPAQPRRPQLPQFRIPTGAMAARRPAGTSITFPIAMPARQLVARFGVRLGSGAEAWAFYYFARYISENIAICTSRRPMSAFSCERTLPAAPVDDINSAFDPSTEFS